MNRPIATFKEEQVNALHNLFSYDKFRKIFLKYDGQSEERNLAKKEKVLRDMCRDDNTFLAFVMHYHKASYQCACPKTISPAVFQRFMDDCAAIIGRETWRALSAKLAAIQESCSFIQSCHVTVWRSYPDGDRTFPVSANEDGNNNNQGGDGDDAIAQISVGHDVEYQNDFDDTPNPDTAAGGGDGGIPTGDFFYSDKRGTKIAAPTREDFLTIAETTAGLECKKARAETTKFNAEARKSLTVERQRRMTIDAETKKTIAEEEQRRMTIAAEEEQRRMTIAAETKRMVAEEEQRRLTEQAKNDGYRLQIQLAQIQLGTPPTKARVTPAPNSRKRKALASPSVNTPTPRKGLYETICEYSTLRGMTGEELTSTLNCKCGSTFLKRNNRCTVQWNGQQHIAQCWYCPCREDSHHGDSSECPRLRLLLTQQDQNTETWIVQRHKKLNVHSNGQSL